MLLHVAAKTMVFVIVFARVWQHRKHLSLASPFQARDVSSNSVKFFFETKSFHTFAHEICGKLNANQIGAKSNWTRLAALDRPGEQPKSKRHSLPCRVFSAFSGTEQRCIRIDHLGISLQPIWGTGTRHAKGKRCGDVYLRWGKIWKCKSKLIIYQKYFKFSHLKEIVHYTLDVPNWGVMFQISLWKHLQRLVHENSVFVVWCESPGTASEIKSFVKDQGAPVEDPDSGEGFNWLITAHFFVWISPVDQRGIGYWLL